MHHQRPRTHALPVWLHDIPSSLVLFLVAVPLSMGIALASGAPVLSGLVAAAVGGIVVGLFGGAPLMVSGPAAGLTVIVFDLVQRFGLAALCGIVVAAGALQVLLGVLRVARLALGISPAVIHGMMAGIGVLITLAQLHVVLGGSPESSALRNLTELPRQIANLHGGATVLGLLTIGILLLWPLLPARVRVVPGALVAVATATGISVAFGLDVPRVELPESLLGSLETPSFPLDRPLAAIGAVLTVALVASAESLLSAVATDKLHGGPRARLDRELIGQGLANMTSGLLGGLPVTGVIVRSTANIEAGARTRLSGILHGVWVVVFVMLLGSLVRQIPLSVLAGLLVVVGVRLVNLAHVRELLRHREAAVYFITLGGVVTTNLLTGIGIGLASAVALLLFRLARVRVRTEQHSGRLRVTVEGALTFLGVPRLTQALADLPPASHVEVDLCVDILDHAAYDALQTWRAGYERGGGHVVMDELHEAFTPMRRREPEAIAESA